MFQKVKVKEKESLKIHHRTEKWGKTGKERWPDFPCRSLFSTVSDRMTASAGCRGISVVFNSLSKVSWCLLFLFSFFFSLRSLSGSSRSSLSCDLVCSFFGRRGSRAKLRGQTVWRWSSQIRASLLWAAQPPLSIFHWLLVEDWKISPSFILIKERADLSLQSCLLF